MTDQTPSAAEVVDVVDEHDRVVGQAPRSQVYDRRLRHRCVFVLVRDGQDRVFVHRRPDHKRVFPSCYDMFVGGVVRAGESYDQAAHREAVEELGVAHLPAPVPALKFRYDSPEHSWWSAVYQVRCVTPVSPPPDEITWHAFLTEAELHRRLGDWSWAADSLAAYHRFREAGR